MNKDSTTFNDQFQLPRRIATVFRTCGTNQNIEPLTVLFIDHTAKIGGGEIALFNLVTHMDRDRFRPVVVLFSDGPLKEKLERAQIDTHLLHLAPSVVNVRKDALGGSILLRFSDVLTTIRHTARLRSFIKRHRIDIVHTNSLKSDVIGGLAARLAGVPVLWHIRDRIDEDYLPRQAVKLFRLLSKWIPNFVVANSAATLATLRLPNSRRAAVIYSGNHSAQSIVVHDGILLGAEALDPRMEKKNPIIGLVGRISPWKGQDVFIRAAAIVLRKFPDAHFQIVGSALFGEEIYERSIRELAGTLGIADRVEFMGFCKDVPERIAAMDILVHASTTGEPFGQVILEGMAEGKPVVATNGGGVPEIVVDGVTGSLVPMGNAQAMADAVCDFLEHPEKAQQMGREGRRRVEGHFTIQQTARRAEAVYEEMLRQRRSPEPEQTAIAEPTEV